MWLLRVHLWRENQLERIDVHLHLALGLERKSLKEGRAVRRVRRSLLHPKSVTLEEGQ